MLAVTSDIPTLASLGGQAASTAINTSNIGAQCVNYANSAGSVNNISNVSYTRDIIYTKTFTSGATGLMYDIGTEAIDMRRYKMVYTEDTYSNASSAPGFGIMLTQHQSAKFTNIGLGSSIGKSFPATIYNMNDSGCLIYGVWTTIDQAAMQFSNDSVYQFCYNCTDPYFYGYVSFYTTVNTTKTITIYGIR